MWRKPLSLSIWDGRKMVEAARKYKRVVQVGTQSRSAPYTDKAAEYIRSGKLGDVYLPRLPHAAIPSHQGAGSAAGSGGPRL